MKDLLSKCQGGTARGSLRRDVWEVLMASRLYGPGRHQSFPVFMVFNAR